MGVADKPATFDAYHAPNGVEVKFITFLSDRPPMKEKPRGIVVHTNAAQREGNVDSAWNHTHARPNLNTIPTYQVDRDGRARKMIPSHIRGICNATVMPGSARWPTLSTATQQAIMEHPTSCREWLLSIETADTGTLADPSISDFTAIQAEVVAAIIAYESIVEDFPLEVPNKWYGAGVLTHTAPFPYPYITIEPGKTCPGSKKKATTINVILPRARVLRSSWTSTTPPDPTPTPPTDVVTYTVVSGDSWWGIANNKLKCSMSDLLRVNHAVESDIIHPGDVLAVPGKSYKVAPNEGWYAIARGCGCPLDQVLAANGATTDTMLHPDQIVKCCTSTTTPPTTPPPTTPTTPPPSTTIPTPSGTPSMRRGDTDASTVVPGVANEGRVSWLQTVIGVPVTGLYDEATEAAIRWNQQNAKITVDGVYGPQTEAVIRAYRGM